MLSLLGYRLFNYPEICSGDSPGLVLPATIMRSFLWPVNRQVLGRSADFQAC